MKIQLVVRHQFMSYQVGDHITDQELVEKFAQTYRDHVIKKTLDDDEPVISADPVANQ